MNKDDLLEEMRKQLESFYSRNVEEIGELRRKLKPRKCDFCRRLIFPGNDIYTNGEVVCCSTDCYAEATGVYFYTLGYDGYEDFFEKSDETIVKEKTND